MAESFYREEFSGLEELTKMLEEYSVSEEKVMDVLEDVANAYVKDVRKLPRPRSQISKPGYTHLLDTVTSKRNKSEIEVGWGKYYGPMVENGTRKMRGAPHLKPTFDKEKYFRNINERLFE